MNSTEDLEQVCGAIQCSVLWNKMPGSQVKSMY